MVFIQDEKDFLKRVSNKIKEYKKLDKIKKQQYILENEGLETIKSKEMINLVNKLESDICADCKCKILFCNYSPYCVYQFSFKRIDFKKIHSFNNLQIVCWNCNISPCFLLPPYLEGTKKKCTRCNH